MNTTRKLPSRALYRIAAALTLIAGIAAAAAYGWLLIFEPEMAKQVTAVSVIGANILAVVVNPLVGFLLWLFLIPFSPFLSFDIHMPAGVPDLSFTRVVGGFITLYLLAEVARGRKRFPALTPIELIIPFFIAGLLLAAVRSNNGWLWGVQAVFDSYIMPLLVYFIARQLIGGRRQFKQLSVVFIVIGVIIAGLAILEQTTGVQLFRDANTAAFYAGDIRKVGALLGNPAYISLAIAVIIPLAIAAGIDASSSRQRLALLGALFVLVVGIILTYNRSGWIGGLLAVLVIALLHRRVARFAIPALLIAGIGVALAWGSLQNSAAGQRITSESPIDYRMEALQYGLQIAQDEPLLGIGWGSFGRTAIRYGFRPAGNVHVLPSTHNTYLNLLVSGGVALLGAFLILGAAVGLTLLRTGLKFRRRGQGTPIYLLAAWASLFAYFIPSAAFDNNFALYANVIFWAIIGGALGAAFGELSESAKTPVSPQALLVTGLQH